MLSEEYERMAELRDPLQRIAEAAEDIAGSLTQMLEPQKAFVPEGGAYRSWEDVQTAYGSPWNVPVRKSPEGGGA